MLSAPGQAGRGATLWLVTVWTGGQEQEPGHQLQPWEERRASTWQQVIMPDLQRQSEASIMPVGLELATCHSSGQRGLLDAHRLLTATGSCVLKLTTENRRVEACPEPGE